MCSLSSSTCCCNSTLLYCCVSCCSLFARVRQVVHTQLSELLESLVYSESVNLAHCLWYHLLHSSQYIPLWLLLTALQHFPHGYRTGPGLSSTSPDIASKSDMIAKFTLDPLTYTLGGEKTAGTTLTLEMMVPPLVQPSDTCKTMYSQVLCGNSSSSLAYLIFHRNSTNALQLPILFPIVRVSWQCPIN